MSQAKPDWQEMRPLGKVTCTSHDCERDLHSFRSNRPRDGSYRNGHCVACGVDLIDWGRLDRHDLSDVSYTVQALKFEMIRHAYWHRPIDETALNHARRKGLQGLREAAEKRLWNVVSLPSAELRRWDGTQTPLSGNVIYYAQHATATCCRKCAEEWHGIDRNRSLTGDEVGYMTELIMNYVKDRLPELPLQGQRVPPRRQVA